MAERIDHLTGLRGIAAYAVLIGHGIHAAAGGTPLLTKTIDGFAVQLAYFGMSGFSVLSGFVIHYNYADEFREKRFPTACRHFFGARFARLYPLYALAILLNCWYLPQYIFADRFGAAFSYLTMTASWFNLEQLVYPPAWSISTEWFFYMVFAFVAPFLLIKRPVWWLIITAGALPHLFLFVYSRPSTEHVLTAWFWHDEKASEQSRSRKSAQDDKWSFCLMAGTLWPANQERP